MRETPATHAGGALQGSVVAGITAYKWHGLDKIFGTVNGTIIYKICSQFVGRLYENVMMSDLHTLCFVREAVIF